MRHSRSARALLRVVPSVFAVICGAASGLLGACGPFTDVSDQAFCPFVLEVFYLGITTGTTPTTFDPAGNVSRLQMSAFLSRTVDGVLKRGSRRAALSQFWTPQNETLLNPTKVGAGVGPPACDGLDVWVPNRDDKSVSRVRASDGSLLGTWDHALGAGVALSAIGRVFITGSTSPGRLYMIDPGQPAGSVTTVASNLVNEPYRLTFDGTHIWTAHASGGSYGVSIVTPGISIPWTVTKVTANDFSPSGILFDGANVWVTNLFQRSLLRLDSGGGVLQTVTVDTYPAQPVFDGTNIWVPNYGADSVSVVRASNGAVLATLTGNGLNHPAAATFDGERVLVTNFLGDSVSLWKAADLTPISNLSTGAFSQPQGACSDGVNFWIAFRYDKLGRL